MPAEDPKSPCNRRCTLDPDTDVCVGCCRTLDEILRWSTMSAEEKQTVLAQLEGRRMLRSQKHAR